MLAPTSLQYGYRKTKDTMKHVMRWTQSEKPLHQSNPYRNMCWSRGAKYLSRHYLFECDSFGGRANECIRTDDELVAKMNEYRHIVTMGLLVQQLVAPGGRLNLPVVGNEVAQMLEIYDWCPVVRAHTDRASERKRMRNVCQRDVQYFMAYLNRWSSSNP